MSTAHDIAMLLEQLGSSRRVRLASSDPHPEGPPVLQLTWPGLESALPDGGLPRGVVELACARALGGATSLALASVRSGQARARTAWCAWIDPEGTLHAPGVEAAGVDLKRMLVVRAPRTQLGRIALKVVSSGAFEVVVIDVDPVPGAVRAPVDSKLEPAKRSKAWAPEVLVRKLALAAEPSGSTVLLLTDSNRPRAAPWPVTLRLELARPNRRELLVRVGKDRRGRVGVVKTVPFYPLTRSIG
jgi:recombination protein RecA